MTWKSTLRSINAAAKRAERESRRRQKEFEARRKQLQKAQELELAQFEVEEYENYIELIQSMHIDCDSEYDWNIIVNSPPSPEPQLSNDSQRIAQHKYGKCQRSCRLEGGTTNETGKRKEALDS